MGGLLPRKTAKGLVKPGGVAKFSYPAKGVSEIPGEMMVIIKTVSK